MKSVLLTGLFLLFLQTRTSAQVSLHLLANYSTRDTISQNEPVILELQLYNAQAEFAETNNIAVRENLQTLEEEYAQGKWTREAYDTEKTILEKAVIMPPDVSITKTSLTTGLQILVDTLPLRDEQFIRCTGELRSRSFQLSGQTRMILLFGIPSHETAQWMTGTHQIQISVDSIFSNPVTVEVTSMPDGSGQDSEIHLGYFYLDCGDPNQALALADRLLSTTPDFLDAVTLKADAFYALQDSAQALENYQRALDLFHQQFPDSYEPPEYLLGQIAALKHED